MIIDGDGRMPKEIAESCGFTGEVKIAQEVKDAVNLVMSNNPEIVEKILKTKAASPVM